VLRDFKTGEFFGKEMSHRSPINSVAFSPNGQILATGSADGTVRLWQSNFSVSRIKPLLGNPKDLLEEWQRKLALKVELDGQITNASEVFFKRKAN